MVCSLICVPAITILAFISDKLGLDHGITGLFLGALVVWISELESNFLSKIAKKYNKEQLFKFQTPIVTLINLILFAFIIGYWRLL